MKRALTCLLAFILWGIAALPAAAGMQLMSIQQLATELGQENLLVVDVRAPKDWDRSNIKIVGAKRMSPKDTGWILDEPKGRRIVLYCA